MTLGSGEIRDLLDGRSLDEAALEIHRRLRGKVAVEPKVQLTEETLELLYTPGVGAVSRALAADAAAARDLTGRGNAVAVVSDGSAVLGLGGEGPVAALPVLEGKALLFRALAEVDALPLALDVADADELIAAIRAIAPGSGAVNLEDIAAPRCFEIERRLRRELDIPVIHDDQHGTAVVTLAALINAARVTGRELSDAAVVLVGAGAGGAATARLLRSHGVRRLAVADSHGALGPERDDLDEAKRSLVDDLDLDGRGEVSELARGADILIGLSVPEAFSVDDVEAMADDAIVLALANPEPEVDSQQARRAGAAVVCTGRSDHENQVNNVLAFPGLFRGALDSGARQVEEPAFLRAAEALAGLVAEPTEELVLPRVLDDRVVPAVAGAVAGAR